MKLKPKEKEKIFNEFKSTILDRSYQRIKKRMLIEINKLNHSIIYSCYIKKEQHFNQAIKEMQYVKLLSNIVSSIDMEITIIFDAFNKKDFEQNIVETIKEYTHVMAIEPRDSFDEAGLQFVDNLCSAIRLSYLDNQNEYYKLIKKNIIEVKK